MPTSRLGYYNSFYPDLLYLDSRGSNGRLPDDYEANLSLSYNFNVGPVTITPQLYVFNLLNRQTTTSTDQRYNIFGNFVTTKTSRSTARPASGGKTDPVSGITCPAGSSAPCSDNADYKKAFSRAGQRLLRAALKISF